MALNETIVSFGTGTANYGTLVGQSLAQLGQQVGQQLANQEYQKQAAAQLPFITQQMQLATREASEGKFGDAYSKIIGLTANPQVTNNPYILPALEMGMQAIKQGSSQAWFNLQNRQQGGGGVGAETEVVYETPTAEQLTDPNYRPRVIITPKSTTTTTTTPTSGGTPRKQALEIDRQTPLPGVEANFTDTVAEMDMGGEGGGGFGFGWSYQEGFRPTADKRKSFEKEYSNFLNAPVEEQQAIKDSVKVPQESIPEGQQTIPFRMALDPNIVGITGPKESVEVEKITQVFKDGSQEDRRELIKTDPLAATINDLQRADRIISGNNTLLNIHKQVEGDYSRVTTDRLGQTDDPKTDMFKIFVDGTEVPDVFTDSLGAEAIGIMKAKEVAAKEGKYEFVTAPAKAAPAAGAPADDALAEARKVFGVSQATTAPSTPAAMQAPPAGIPAVEWEKLTPIERERIMTERVRGAIKTGVGAVMRGGEAILRGARAIR